MFRDVNAEIRDTFRRARLRYTSQRHAMLEHLWQSAGHLTAEQIFAGINVRRHHRFHLRTMRRGWKTSEGFDVSGLQRPQLGSRVARNCDIVFRGPAKGALNEATQKPLRGEAEWEKLPDRLWNRRASTLTF